MISDKLFLIIFISAIITLLILKKFTRVFDKKDSSIVKDYKKSLAYRYINDPWEQVINPDSIPVPIKNKIFGCKIYDISKDKDSDKKFTYSFLSGKDTKEVSTIDNIYNKYYSIPILKKCKGDIRYNNTKCLKDDLSLVNKGDTSWFFEECIDPPAVPQKYPNLFIDKFSYDGIVWINYNNYSDKDINTNKKKFLTINLSNSFMSNSKTYYNASYNDNKPKIFKIVRYGYVGKSLVEIVNGPIIKISYFYDKTNKEYYLTYIYTKGTTSILSPSTIDKDTLEDYSLVFVEQDGDIKGNFFMINRIEDNLTSNIILSSIIYIPPETIIPKSDDADILEFLAKKDTYYLTLAKDILIPLVNNLLIDPMARRALLTSNVQQIEDTRKSFDYNVDTIMRIDTDNYLIDIDIPYY